MGTNFETSILKIVLRGVRENVGIRKIDIYNVRLKKRDDMNYALSGFVVHKTRARI